METEFLKTKEAKKKLRRFEFVASIQIGEGMQNLKLDAVFFGTMQEARQHGYDLEENIRSTSPTFQQGVVRVKSFPKERVSKQTLTQLMGFRELVHVCDKALEYAIKDAADVVAGRIVGSQFVERGAVEALGSFPAEPARTLQDIKAYFYDKAVKSMVPKEEAPLVELTDDKEVLVENN